MLFVSHFIKEINQFFLKKIKQIYLFLPHLLTNKLPKILVVKFTINLRTYDKLAVIDYYNYYF